MKLCCISDTHGKHDELDLSTYPADVLIHAGDFSNGKAMQLIGFLEWFAIQPYKHLIFIAGNHDKLFEDTPEECRRILSYFPNVTYLQDTAVTIEGINFYGSPYSNEFCNWAFMEDEPELTKIWDKIPDNTNVLITHGPAYGCHDKVNNSYGNDPHVGSKSLHYKKLALQGTLKAHISGHIHEAYGVSITTGIANVCACILDESYSVTNGPVLLEI